MSVLTAQPERALKSYLESKSITGTIYDSGVPTTGVAGDFISLSMNGALRAKSEDAKTLVGTIMVGVCVPLLSNKTINQVKEKLILEKLDGFFPCKYTFESITYDFSLDLKNLVYSGRDLIAGYSTKALNLQVFIY